MVKIVEIEDVMEEDNVTARRVRIMTPEEFNELNLPKDAPNIQAYASIVSHRIITSDKIDSKDKRWVIIENKCMGLCPTISGLEFQIFSATMDIKQSIIAQTFECIDYIEFSHIEKEDAKKFPKTKPILVDLCTLRAFFKLNKSLTDIFFVINDNGYVMSFLTFTNMKDIENAMSVPLQVKGFADKINAAYKLVEQEYEKATGKNKKDLSIEEVVSCCNSLCKQKHMNAFKNEDLEKKLAAGENIFSSKEEIENKMEEPKSVDPDISIVNLIAGIDIHGNEDNTPVKIVSHGNVITGINETNLIEDLSIEVQKITLQNRN